MVHLDLKTRGEGSEMEVIVLGTASGREDSCPKLDTCDYANRGEGLIDKEKFEQCGTCFWNYEDCKHYK